MLNSFIKSSQVLLKRKSMFSLMNASFCDSSGAHKHECPDYQRLLDGNDLFVRQKNFNDPNYFKRHAKGQSPKYLFIGCSDSRVPPNDLTGTGPGELFIHRNVANLVEPADFNINAVIQYAVEVIKVKHIIVMGHTQCGGIKAALEDKHHGMIDQWLSPIREIHYQHRDELEKIEDPEARLKRLTELTVKEQVLNLCKNQFVQKAWASRQELEIHGWVCEIETGKVIDLNVEKQEWSKIKDYFRLRF